MPGTEQLIASDALVLFGATGDLAHKKIFPALQKLAKRGKWKPPAKVKHRVSCNLLSPAVNCRKISVATLESSVSSSAKLCTCCEPIS